MATKERVILHADMNNFYASVECMLNPKLRGHPVAVGGDVEARHGIILAKNYEAKAYGIQTGEALWQAKQKCKDLIIVPPHYEEYLKYSRLARSIYEEYTDRIQPYGMDENWLDVTGSKGLFGDGETIANTLRERIKFELGLTISVGVSFNMTFAKLGSDMKKPDAVTVIPRDSFREKIWHLPASDMLGVGRATEKFLVLSYLLRHAPETAELDMDRHGWVSVSQLISNVNTSGKAKLTEELLQEIVATDSKGRYRFSPDGKRIKACQGHSIPWVEPELEVRTPPEYLYHGTTTEALQDIVKSGAILKMSRHAVHMQADINKAWQSAERRKNNTPVVLKIAAGRMSENGFVFSISENDVWFCERVPTEYVEEFLYTKD